MGPSDLGKIKNDLDLGQRKGEAFEFLVKQNLLLAGSSDGWKLVKDTQDFAAPFYRAEVLELTTDCWEDPVKIVDDDVKDVVRRQCRHRVTRAGALGAAHAGQEGIADETLTDDEIQLQKLIVQARKLSASQMTQASTHA